MARIAERRCSFESCRQLLKDDWRYCPNCGTDQTPGKPPVDYTRCDHTMELSFPFCVICGYDSEAFMGVQPPNRLKVGAMYIAVSVILFCLSGYMISHYTGKPLSKAFWLGIALATVMLGMGTKIAAPRRSERAKR